MIPEGTKRLVPGVPATLSFNKEEFMKDDFNVDHFVVECRRRVPLETLRDDLSVYLKMLQSAMIELINKDYADFVNLSSNLVGVDKAINNLTTPLENLKEEILKVRVALEEAIVSVEEKIGQQTAVRNKKVALQRLMAITESVDKMEKLLQIQPSEAGGAQPGAYDDDELNGQLIERVATEFNKLQFYVNKSLGAPLVEHIKPRIANITGMLQVSLERSFSEGLETNNALVLRQCLRTYATIDKMRDAENHFRQHIVKPYMETVISEQSISQQGLKGMYQNILDFIPKHCYKLKDALSKGGEVVRGYDFPVNAVWAEVVTNIEARTPSIFAPGNPTVFHEKYKISLQFLDNYERLCGSQASVKRLRAHPSYNIFMSKWSLPVYFQIRFQEIAGNFEASLTDAFTAAPEGSHFHLSATETLWSCIHHCWEPEVYLTALSHRFWKLTLQLVARYTTWVHEVYTKQLKAPSSVPERSDSPVVKIASSETERVATPPPPPPTLVTMAQIVMVIADARTLADKMPEFYKKTVEPHLTELGMVDTNILTESLDEACGSLLASLPQFIDHIEEEITAQCAVHVKLVTDTPRLYRRTNRDVPTKPSTYIGNLLKPLITFIEEQRSVLPAKNQREVSISILNNLTEQYYQTTSDVLTSVRKMEESLKRLKKGKNKTGGASGPTDDDKIRLQLLLDVKGYGDQINKTGVTTTDVEPFKKLLDLVESATNGNNAS